MQAAVKKGNGSLFSICAVPNCQFIPRTVFLSLLLSPASYIHRVVQFVVVLCWFHHTLHNDMAHNKIMLCSLSLPRVFSRDLKPVVCSCERARKNSEGSHPNLAVRAFQFRFTTWILISLDALRDAPATRFFPFHPEALLARTRRAQERFKSERANSPMYMLGVTCNYRRALKLAPSRSHSPRYAHLCAPRAPQGPSRLFCSLFSRWPPPYLRVAHKSFEL